MVDSYTDTRGGPSAAFLGGLVLPPKFPSKRNFRFLLCSVLGWFLEHEPVLYTEDLFPHSLIRPSVQMAPHQRGLLPALSMKKHPGGLSSPLLALSSPPNLFSLPCQILFFSPTSHPQIEAPRESGLYFVHDCNPVPRIASDP